MRNRRKMYHLTGGTAPIDLDCEAMEWLLNSLQLMQIQQQELARKFNQEHPKVEEGDPDFSEDLFQPQLHSVTELREKLVGFIGRDLTDTGC
jgi:hypothetical protein